MVRKYLSRNTLALGVADQLVLAGSLAAALWIKTRWLLADPELPVQLHVDLFVRQWPFLALTLALAGAYDLQVAVGGIRPLLWRTLRATAAMAAVWLAGMFYWRLSDLGTYSRAVSTLFIALAAGGLVGVRMAYAQLLLWWWRRAGTCRRVVVFGGEQLGPRLVRQMQEHVFAPVRVIGATGRMCMDGVPHLTEEEALERIRQGAIDHILVDLPPGRVRLIRQLAQIAEREGVPLQVTPSVFPGVHLSPRMDRIGDVPVLELCGGEIPLSGVLAKRLLDVVFAAVGIVVLTPVWAAAAIAIRLTAGSPVLYTQERVGLNGRRFRIYKFRTMVNDAEHDTGPVWARDNDPRATRIGRILRRTNVDELPQLLNVLRGEMSLVGPRPERPEFVERFKPVVARYSHKHWVKPGITGWAQVNGWRGRTDLRRRIEHDIYYIERWSIWFDLKILTMTVLGRNRHAA